MSDTAACTCGHMKHDSACTVMIDSFIERDINGVPFKRPCSCMARWKISVKQPDVVTSPSHYTAHPVIECIDVAEHFPFNVGNVIKYAFRAGKKGTPEDAVRDLRKAAWYATREADRLEKEQKK